MKIGVLASQGAFAEHLSILNRLKAEAVQVRLPGDLKGLQGLIIPGGESTSISGLLLDYKLVDEIKALSNNGTPIFGTCAGMILLSKKQSNNYPETLGLMDITVRRNAFGRQRESFEVDLDLPALGEKPFHAIFIRAPVIERAGEKVEVLGKLTDGSVVAVRQDNKLASAFHPELTDDLRFHQYFLDIVTGKR